jgi:transposase
VVCEPLLPAPAWLAGKGGRPSRYCMREVVDGIRYLTLYGPVWRALPADFPAAGTICWWAAAASGRLGWEDVIGIIASAGPEDDPLVTPVRTTEAAQRSDGQMGYWLRDHDPAAGRGLRQREAPVRR